MHMSSKSLPFMWKEITQLLPNLRTLSLNHLRTHFTKKTSCGSLITSLGKIKFIQNVTLCVFQLESQIKSVDILLTS